jgi:hypothetical protein
MLRDRDDEMPFREMVRLCLRWTLAFLPSMLVLGVGYYVLMLLYFAIMMTMVGGQILFSQPH